MGNGTEGERSGGLDHRQILLRESEAAVNELERDVRALTLSSFTAGLNVSFGALLMLMALSMHDFGSGLTEQLTLGALSSIGFIIVMIGQTELFTAHTTMSVIPLFRGDTTGRRVVGRWAVMLAANLLGTAGFAALVAALVAGWLMGLATWLSQAARDTAGQVFAIVLTTGAIGLGPFHHVVLGSTELLTALFAGTGTSWSQYLHVFIWATLGNTVGGAIFVGLLNYGQTIGEDAPDAAG